ncbi:MAG TPA: trypsin-like peptidase domain-containing protein [Thermomicrobiales bacterium]|nr:trypsin-like peptidase domain-containing protein [Thermomicrobiales bacterium]
MIAEIHSGGLIANALSDELEGLAARVQAGVVEISDGRGTGAGTNWSSDGLIVTNHHVVPGESARVGFTDGRVLDARVVSSLPERDLTLLKVEAIDLPALPVGDSAVLRPGEIVLAVGHPHGIPSVVTFGIFSRFGPYEGDGRVPKHLREGLLADIELRPGNSGGPLVNANGEVVGINAMVLGPGTAMAVPSATVRRLLAAGERRTLGVQIGVVNAGATSQQEPHLMVLDVVPASEAARAGLLPGDMLLAIGGQALEEPGDIALALREASAAESLSLTIQRAGRRLDVLVAPAG